MTTHSEHRLPYRFARQGAGLLAAALAVPAAAVVAPAIAEASGPEVVHTTGCYHAVWSRPGDRDELDRLRAAFEATGPTEEQLELHVEMQDKLGEVMDEEYDRFVEGLERHLPGLAPAIRLVAYHV